MNIKREGGPEDPVEGSNVTLICDFRGYEYPYSPNWFYLNCSEGCKEWGTSSYFNGKVFSSYYVPNYRQLNFAHTNFKNDAKLNEIVKISEQPTKGL